MFYDSTPVLLPSSFSVEVGGIDVVIDGVDVKKLWNRFRRRRGGSSSSSASPPQNSSSAKTTTAATATTTMTGEIADSAENTSFNTILPRQLKEGLKLFRWTSFSLKLARVTLSFLGEDLTSVGQVGKTCLSVKEDNRAEDDYFDDDYDDNNYGRISLTCSDVYGSVDDVKFVKWERIDGVVAVCFLNNKDSGSSIMFVVSFLSFNS